MQFKSLEIQGFKSFADKTLIEFPRGITAIVGPNGSGKSNIMDALRWVFGEQRPSELRGDDMEDLIFSGSAARRSVGFAQVTLTLGDISAEVSGKWGSMSEISVSRKMYRTGEREYWINGRKARLKDVRDIFFDTGLGSRSISVIEQERVTKIVSSTPYELRYFLEETAGLVRYKERRKEAEARLKQTRENLIRISDIISLLAVDMERLVKQVEELKQYRHLRKVKNDLEKSAIAAAYALLLKNEKTHKAEINSHRTEMVRYSSVHSKKVNEEIKIIQMQEELRLRIKELREVHGRAKSAQAKAESDIRHMQAGRENAEQQKKQLEHDIEEARARETELRSRLEAVEKNITDMGKRVDEFTENLEECRHELELYRSELSWLSGVQKENSRIYLSLVQKVSECANKLSLKQAENASLGGSKERLQKERESLLGESAMIGKRFAEAAQYSKELEEEAARMEKEQEGALAAYQAKAEEYAGRRKIYDDINMSVQRSKDKISFLQQEVSSKNVGGKAGKLLLEKFHGKRYVEMHPSEENYLLYGDLLVFDGKEKDALLEYVKGLDLSFRFIFDLYLPVRRGAVEKISEGFYHHDGIFIKAGSDNEAVALMRLKQRLADEEENFSVLSRSFQEETEAVEMLRLTVEELYNHYNAKNDRLKSKKLEYSNILTSIAHFDEQNRRILKNISVVEQEMNIAFSGSKDIEGEIGRLKETYEALLAEQKRLADKQGIWEEKTEQTKRLLEEKRDGEVYVSHELTRYIERKAAAEAEEKQLRINLSGMLETVKTLSERLKGVSCLLGREWGDKMDELYALQDRYAKDAIDLSGQLSYKERQQLEYETSVGEVRKELTGLGALLHEYDKKIAYHEGKIESVSAGIEALRTEMAESFGEELGEVWENYYTDKADQKKIAADIAAVTDAMEAMGALNMAAEEEYAVKSAQYSQQRGQMQDVEGAVATLSGLISEIDDNTATLFKETFDAVRKNFSDVFNRFFGSGKADLLLTEPEDMLNTGVALMFNPPGKRISNKNLLSGGEKALAALTLLFALFLQKPTPFCFLDEVDAPLDDGNAEKFIAMLQLLAQDTQFVIITHKHLTMAAADSLYGITMQEGGVSTLLSVAINAK